MISVSSLLDRRSLVWKPALACLVLLVCLPTPWAKPRKNSSIPARNSASPAGDAVLSRELASAQAALAAGRAVEAHDRIRRILSSADAESRLTPAQREEARAVLATALPAAGDVVVLGEPGTLVRVDEQDTARLPLPVPLLVPVGQHQIECVLGGTALRVQVQVRSGRRVEVRANREAGAILLSQPPHALLQAQLLGPGLSGTKPAPWVEQGLRGTPLVLLSMADDVTQQLASCKEQAACLREVAVRSEAEYVVLISSQADPERRSSATETAAASPDSDSASAASPDLLLRVALFDPVVEAVAAQEQLRCAACSQQILGGQIAQLVSRVSRQGLGRPRARVRIRMEPADAELSLNGASVAALPIDRNLWAGELHIEARRAGYLPLQKTVLLAEGSSESLELRLDPIPPPVAVVRPAAVTPAPIAIERGPRPPWRIAVGLAALAAGGSLVGFGSGALAVHGTCIDATMPPANQCDRLYQTSTVGAALVSVGAVSAVAGVVLLAVPGPRRPMRAARSRP